METIYIRENIFKNILLLMGGIFLEYICIVIAIGEITIEKMPLFSQVVAIIGAITFPIGLLYIILNLFVNIFTRKPFLCISMEGITHNELLGLGFIPWSNIKKIYIDKSQFATRTLIRIELKDNQKFLQQLSKWKKILFKFLISYNKSLISYNCQFLEISSTEVLEIMQKYKAEYDRLHEAENS